MRWDGSGMVFKMRGDCKEYLCTGNIYVGYLSEFVKLLNKSS